MFITACSWVIPELLGVDTTNVLDAQHPQLDTKNALWTHTRMSTCTCLNPMCHSPAALCLWPTLGPSEE